MLPMTRSIAALVAVYSVLVTASPLTTPAEVEQTSPNPSDVLRRNIAKRNNVGVACGLWATANWSDSGSGLGEDNDEVSVAPMSCNRIGCYDTSGVYVCNDQEVEIKFPMSEAIDQVDYLKDMCEGDFMSGQVFSNNYGGYNLNIGYCNNDHPVNVLPSMYTFPGPNGDPDITCGGNSGIPCEGASCIEGTIKVDSQESLNCNDFLGPFYGGAGSTSQYSTSRTIGETWTVGGFLSIDTSDLFVVSYSAGFTSSYAETTTTGSIAGIIEECGATDDGDYTCAMHVSPRCIYMTGTCETETLGTVPWADQAPELDSPNGQSVYYAEICTCPNCPDALNPGAPELCPTDCATCDPNV